MSIISVVVLSLNLGCGQVRAEMEEVVPGDHSIQLGISGGAFVPGKGHGLGGGSNSAANLSSAGMSFSLRLGYLPWRYVGAEFEAGHVAVRAEEGDVGLYALRGHIIAMLPGRLAPFLVVGGGVLGLTSRDETVGSERAPAIHWGVGAEFLIDRTVALRLDGRHAMSQGDHGALAHHLEVQGGVTFTLSRADDAPAVAMRDTTEVAPAPVHTAAMQ